MDFLYQYPCRCGFLNVNHPFHLRPAYLVRKSLRGLRIDYIGLGC